MLLLWPRIFCWPWCHTYQQWRAPSNILESVACWPTPLHALDAIHVRCRTTAIGGIDRRQWWCPECRAKKSIRTGSFFSHSHPSLNQLILFIYLWSEDVSLEFIQRQISMQDVGTYGHGLGKHDQGGVQPRPNGQLREMAASTITAKPESSRLTKASSSLGNTTEACTGMAISWALGAVEQETGRCQLQVVANRDRAMLNPTLEQWLLLGTHIISDGWAACIHLDQLNQGVYLHDVIIHEPSPLPFTCSLHILYVNIHYSKPL